MTEASGQRHDQAASEPFKAAQSYGPADDLLFHGRDADGAALAQFLADRPFAVLTAPSGTGKTSLLQARTMPLLESERWMTVYTRPQDAPDQALVDALTAQLLPDPRAEVDAVRRLMQFAPGSGTCTMAAALSWYKALDVRDRVAYRHFAPEDRGGTEPLPMVCRTLRGSIALTDLIEHLEAIAADGSALNLTPLTTLADFAAALSGPGLQACWTQWVRRLQDSGSLSGAVSVFHAQWSPLRPGITGLILVLDQVEEVFTRLTVGSIESLLGQASRWSTTAQGQCPVHLTISLRKEFFADVVPYLGPFGSVERLTFFLSPMTAMQAQEALGKPARLFGVDFEAADPQRQDDIGCLAQVLCLTIEEGSELARQDFRGGTEIPSAGSTSSTRFAPALISLVGAHLWSRLHDTQAVLPVVLSWQQFTQLVPKLEDVFLRFLERALSYFDTDPAQTTATRFDALELLEHLVTSTGYRNIVAENELIDKLSLHRSAAVRLLDDMDQRLKLIRRERRGRARFVEIMHERLISPVRRMMAELRQRDAPRAALAQAHDMVRVLPDDVDTTRDPLPSPHYREALVLYMRHIDLDRLACKHLLRSLVNGGPADTAGTDDMPGLQRWKASLVALTQRFQSAAADDPARWPLLVGTELNDEIDVAFDAPGADRHRIRHVLLSTLADRNDAAGARIRRAFASFVRQKHAL